MITYSHATLSISTTKYNDSLKSWKLKVTEDQNCIQSPDIFQEFNIYQVVQLKKEMGTLL